MNYLEKLKILFAKLLTFYLPKNVRKKLRRNIILFNIFDYFHFKNLNYHIVSLGNNCVPRVITTAGKLKPRKLYGEKSCPFDNSIHGDIKKICDLIKNDFKNYFDGLEFSDEGHWVNPKISANYLHDRDSKEQFVKRYQNRIKNFVDLYSSPKKIYYIWACPKALSLDLEKLLYNTIKEKRQNDNFEIIYITPPPHFPACPRILMRILVF